MAESGTQPGYDSAGNSEAHLYDAETVRANLEKNAKGWWGASLALKSVAFALGMGAIVLSLSGKQTPFLMAAITLLAEIAGYRSDSVKGASQSLRRKLDMRDSFGWEISKAEYADMLVRMPWSVKRASRSVRSDVPYFQSREPASPRRALQNVRESSWWSKHLAEKLWQMCLALLIGSLVVSIAALVVAINAAASQVVPATNSGAQPLDALLPVARVVNAALTFLLSLGLVRLVIGYYGFSQKAAVVEKTADILLKEPAPREIDAIKTMHEYHLARASAPLLPAWLWKSKRDEWNLLWKNRAD